jgi:hypothetical protein
MAAPRSMPGPVRTPRSATNVLSLGVLGAALLIFGYQGLAGDDGLSLRPVQDYVITHSFSQQVAEHHEYFKDFTYALPAVVFKLLFAAPGLAVSSVLWMALLIGAAFAACRAFVVLLGRQGNDRAYLAPVLGFAAMVYAVQWDYRAVNTNTILLALVLWSLVASVRDRPRLAGMLVATSIALKLYGVVLLPYLLLRGRRDILVPASLWLVFYFVVVPVLYFGPSDALSLSLLWAETILATSAPGFVAELIAYKVSLQHVMLSLLTEYGAADGVSRAQLRPERVFLLTRCLQLAVLFGVAGYLVWVRRRPCAAGEGTRLLLEVGMSLLAMLLLSPLLQTHHAVLLVIPATVMVDVALDARERPWLRAFAASTVGGCALLQQLAPSGADKGIALCASSLAFIAAAAVLRDAMCERPAGAKAPGVPRYSAGVSDSSRSTAS